MGKPLVVRHKGRAGNRLFQYFFCAELARRAGTHTVRGVHIPDLDLETPPAPDHDTGFLHIEGKHLFDVPALVAALRDGAYAGATFRGFAMRQAYYDRAFCQRLLPLRPGASEWGFGPEFLTINIRAGDVFSGASAGLMAGGYGGPYGAEHLYPGIHPDYRPLPLGYYETLTRDTGLKPAFVGELSSHPAYEAALRRRFPQAVFARTRSPKEDFLTLLGSSNIALAISSFSWIAAWLSEARTIHIPVAGMFDPHQRPDIDLLPPDSDTRYIRHTMPRLQWQGTTEQIAELFA
ncbi:hypothetical protein [Hydrogenophaga electricum]|uniref:Uncharacterized protein n=1 Tax=Hydrogenophaga electricum TaxID=1230953 RepID=A0ABQ6C903_9BURK|nr:hypothetical protein [Hydrogenophaga electricum]GLS16309.1 hypothetical protein GCM10007935_37490 [Hydrogenophaga electricum]